MLDSEYQPPWMFWRSGLPPSRHLEWRQVPTLQLAKVTGIAPVAVLDACNIHTGAESRTFKHCGVEDSKRSNGRAVGRPDRQFVGLP